MSSRFQKYVYVGKGFIRTLDGIRSNIDAGLGTSQSFRADSQYLRRARELRPYIMLESEYEQVKARQSESVEKPKRRRRRKKVEE